MEKIILVDERDKQVGTEEKIKAHKEGKLHRAFSIFIFNSKGETLLQKRAREKYHSGGLWTNACCSHPRAGEALDEAAHRRLKEEMCFDCPLKEIFSFIYKVKFGNGLTEHELDHVFTGRFQGKPKPNPEEAEDCEWVSVEWVKEDIRKNPQNYTYWFKVALKRMISSGIKF